MSVVLSTTFPYGQDMGTNPKSKDGGKIYEKDQNEGWSEGGQGRF